MLNESYEEVSMEIKKEVKREMNHHRMKLFEVKVHTQTHLKMRKLYRKKMVMSS